MTSQANAETPITETDAKQVRDFLSSHPDFFDDQQELLIELQLSHSTSGNAVSLIERQVQTLRSQNQELKQHLLELVDVARDNDRLGERLHQLTLELIGADSLTTLIDKLDDQLRNEFNADVIILHLPGLDESQQRETGAQPLVIDDELKQLLPTQLCDSKPQCGRLKQAQTDFLFGNQAAAIESSALIPLGENAHAGLLSIGSRETNRFNPSMGTLFLTRLGETVTRLLNDLNNH